jgi:ABC-type transport system involved in multi-copper enzyme maturation permease subunit
LSLISDRAPQVLKPIMPSRGRHSPASFISSVWAIFVKDLLLWLRQPLQIIGSLLVPVSYTVVVFLGAQATTTQPAAVVNLDQGPVGAQLARAVADAGVFRVYQTSPARASQMYDDLQVSLVITIPADTSQLVAANEQAPVDVRANNLNFDLAGDIRRSVPDAITTYYAGLGQASPIHVTIAQDDIRARDVQLYQYSVLPVIILIVTVNGIISSGMAVAGEFEKKTIKELLLAPVSRFTIIAGKMMAGFVSTFVLATAMLVVGAAANLTRPQGVYWVTAIIAIALSSAFSAGLGIAIGTWFQRKQPVTIGATIAAVELFALAGGIGVIWFEPEWLQRIAAFDPLTYGIHALQISVFYNSFTGVVRDCIVLVCTSAAAAGAGALAMRRGLVAQ